MTCHGRLAARPRPSTCARASCGGHALHFRPDSQTQDHEFLSPIASILCALTSLWRQRNDIYVMFYICNTASMKAHSHVFCSRTSISPSGRPSVTTQHAFSRQLQYRLKRQAKIGKYKLLTEVTGQLLSYSQC